MILVIYVPMAKCLSVIELVRPVNALIAFASVLLGGWISGRPGALSPLMVAGMSAAFLAGAANALNDVCDAEVDRINRPKRPIPSGRVTKRQAKIASAILFPLGWILAGTVSTSCLILALGVSVVLLLYDLRLKRIALLGNLAVSSVGGLAFVYGGLAVGRPADGLIPAGFAFLFHLGREIIKDTEDVSGDREGGAATLPVLRGIRTALATATGAFGILVLLTFVPFYLGLYGWPYLAIVVFGVDSALIYAIVSMWRNNSPSNLRRVSAMLKADMMIGLGAILAGARL